MTNAVVGARSPERVLVADMARLGLIVGPILVAVGTIFWGFDGLISSLFAFGLVVANFALGALIIERAAAISLNALMGAVLASFAARLLLLTVIVVPVRHLSWFEVVPFSVALVGGHLGLLSWESQRVAANLSGVNGPVSASPVGLATNGPATNGPATHGTASPVPTSPSNSLPTRSESE
jgi:hypothetical protein